MKPILGCIADDFTGATDLAGVLASDGMTVSIVLDARRAPLPTTDAVIVALKIRTAAVDTARREASEALDWLLRLGCGKFYLKYCSTFDSRPTGNIGTVIDVMMDQLGAGLTVACPAFPANGRTVYQSNLFVDDQLLSESSMRQHPLTPMTDCNLVRLLQPQTKRSVGSVGYGVVVHGIEAIREALRLAKVNGTEIAVMDAVREEDLRNIAIACSDLKLLTGASGLALGLPEQLRRAGMLSSPGCNSSVGKVEGYEAVLAGSCSSATRRQVTAAARSMPVFQVDPMEAVNLPELTDRISAWAGSRLPAGPVLISSSAAPSAVARAQEQLGPDKAGSLIEDAIAASAVRLAEQGVRKFVVAGGETSGAVVSALKINSLRLGRQIDPGVSWTLSDDGKIALALKSGNFGADDFFLKAWSFLR